jgi:hypothetical protein
MFDYYEHNPKHAARFAKAMAGVAGGTLIHDKIPQSCRC